MAPPASLAPCGREVPCQRRRPRPRIVPIRYPKKVAPPGARPRQEAVMAISRRSFLSAFGTAEYSAEVVAARGTEAAAAAPAGGPLVPPESTGGTEVRIDSNENPLGPSKKAMDALFGAFEFAGRYPTNSPPAAV